MIINYLTEDIIGAASKKVYGKKNDKVYIIKRQDDNMCVVINEKGDKFFARHNQLSNLPSGLKPKL